MNPATLVPTSIPVQHQEPRKRLDSIDTVRQLRLMRERTSILAKITALSPNNNGDEFVADLYADGRVTVTAPETTYKTHQGILIYNPDIYTTHAVGDLVYVNLNPDMTGIIVDVSDATLPVGQYQYQLYGMVSTNQTGFTYALAHAMTPIYNGSSGS